MLPKFAPIVCKQWWRSTVFAVRSSQDHNAKRHECKQRYIIGDEHAGKEAQRESTSINCRVVRTFVSSAEPRNEKDQYSEIQPPPA